MAAVVFLLGPYCVTARGALFTRGDVNASGTVDLSDAVKVFEVLFLGTGARFNCREAADVNDSGKIDISDGVSILSYLFLGGAEPPVPFRACGNDPTPDGLGCEEFPPCAEVVVKDNVRVIAASGGFRDPKFITLDAHTTTLKDPPGGVDVKIGDVIVGEIPRESPAAVHGLAYMRRVTGSVNALGTDVKVFQTEPADLADVFEKFSFRAMADFTKGTETFTHFDPMSVCANGIGAAALAQGGGAAGIDINEDSTILIDESGPDGTYIRVSLNQAHLTYDASLFEVDAGYNPFDGIIDGFHAKVFSGVQLDGALEVTTEGQWHGHFEKEKPVYHNFQSTVYWVGGFVPIQMSFTSDLYLGVEGNAEGAFYSDLGVGLGTSAGIGFEIRDGKFRDLTGFKAPHAGLDPAQPFLRLNGNLDMRAYARPRLEFYVGLPLDIGGGRITVDGKAYLRFEMDGSGSTGVGGGMCLNYQADFGVEGSIEPALVIAFAGNLSTRIPVKLDPVTVVPRTSIGCVNHKTVPEAILRITSVTRVPHFPTAFVTYNAQFDASASFDADNNGQGPNGGIQLYQWDFDNDGWCDLLTTTPFAEYDYWTEQGWKCHLRVVDDEGCMAETTIERIIPR